MNVPPVANACVCAIEVAYGRGGVKWLTSAHPQIGKHKSQIKISSMACLHTFPRVHNARFRTIVLPKGQNVLFLAALQIGSTLNTNGLKFPPLLQQPDSLDGERSYTCHHPKIGCIEQ